MPNQYSLIFRNIGGGRGEVGMLEHPQLSRLRYSNRAVTLIQQSAQNSYSLLISQYSQKYTILWPQIPAQIQSKFPGGACPQTPLKSPQVGIISTPNLFNLPPPMRKSISSWFWDNNLGPRSSNLHDPYYCTTVFHCIQK